MLALGFVGWIVIGGLAGWIASKIKGNDAEQGILMRETSSGRKLG